MKYRYVYLIIFLVHGIYAQEIAKDIYLKHTTLQDGLTYQFAVKDSKELPKDDYDITKFYYWYKAQRIVITQGGASGQLLHGPFTAYYDSKQLFAQGNFVSGVKDGKWQYWSDAGFLLRMEQWKKGIKSGVEESYSVTGKLLETCNYRKRGYVRQTSDSLIKATYAGDKKKIFVYAPNGELKGKYTYVKGTLISKKENSEKPQKEHQKKEVKHKTWLQRLKKRPKEVVKPNATETDKTQKDTKKSCKIWRKAKK